MFKSLNPDMVSIKEPLEKIFDLAGRNGFAGLDLSIPKLKELEEQRGAGSAKRLFDESGLRPGIANGLLPLRLAVDAKEWDEFLARLPAMAELAQRIGFTRTTIVMLPFHDSLAFDACFDLCVRRLKQAAARLGEHGIRLGVEYVSQLTRRAGQAHEFIYDLKGTLPLIEAVGAVNVGLLLDSFHWHCASESTAAILALKGSQIIDVHLADAPDRPLEKQVAMERELPGEGVGDLAGFCRAVRATGYDGPAACEPFRKAFETMPAMDIAACVSKSLDRVMG